MDLLKHLNMDYIGWLASLILLFFVFLSLIRYWHLKLALRNSHLQRLSLINLVSDVARDTVDELNGYGSLSGVEELMDSGFVTSTEINSKFEQMVRLSEIFERLKETELGKGEKKWSVLRADLRIKSMVDLASNAKCAIAKSAILVNELRTEVKVLANLDQFDFIITTLLIRAIETLPAQGTVFISASKEKGQVYFRIKTDPLLFTHYEISPGRLETNASVDDKNECKSNPSDWLLAKIFAEANMGEITLHQDENGGSVFTLSFLPL